MYSDEVVCEFCYLLLKRDEADRVTSPLKKGKDVLYFCRDTVCVDTFYRRELENGNTKL